MYTILDTAVSASSPLHPPPPKFLSFKDREREGREWGLVSIVKLRGFFNKKIQVVHFFFFRGEGLGLGVDPLSSLNFLTYLCFLPMDSFLSSSADLDSQTELSSDNGKFGNDVYNRQQTINCFLCL